MPGIRATRDEVSDRFPVVGFTVQTGSDRYFEIMLTTDPALPREQRSPQNFFSTRANGALMAERGEAVFLAPPEVLQQFRSSGADKIYYGLATFPDAARSRVDFVRAPEEHSPYVSLRSFTGRGSKRMQLGSSARTPRRGGPGNYSSSPDDLSWAGDQPQPGAEKIANPPSITPKAPAEGTSPAVKNGASTAPSQTAALAYDDYDDGFGTMPALPLEETPADEPGIEGPIPDGPPTSAGLNYSRAQTISPEYPQASRFVAANAANFRPTSGPRTINRIVIHITDGGANINGPISWFQNPSARVSAHYIVGQDGEVVQMVLHKDVAWHARAANGDSIGIEHVANTRGLNPTQAEYCASAALVSWLCDQFGIPKDRDHIVGHSEADSSTTHRGCPNAVWDWPNYMQLVTTGSCADGQTVESARPDATASQGGAGEAPSSSSSAAGPAASQSLGVSNGHKNGKASQSQRNGGGSTMAHPKIPTAPTGRSAALDADDIPLDPGAGGLCIDASALAVGDIIVSTTGAFISGAIRWATGSPVSHAMLYIGDGLVVDSIGSGVDVRTLEQAMSDATLAVAFRVPTLTADQAALAKDFVGRQIHSGYDHVGILEQALFQLSGQRVRVNLGSATNDRFFCSELIFAAFAAAGAPLSANPPSWGSPDDLAHLRLTHVLEYVGHLKAPSISGAQSLGFAASMNRAKAATRPMDSAPDDFAAGLRAEGLSDDEVAKFLSDWGVDGATPARASSLGMTRALEGEPRIQVTRPAVRVLPEREARILRTAWRVAQTAPIALFPPLGPLESIFLTWLLTSLPDQARQHNVTIGIGPNVGGFAVAGGSIGGGIVIGPDGRIGVYGGIELGAGWAISLSAVMQVTIVRGAIEDFAGEGVAIVVAGGEAIVGGVAVLFTPDQQFQGVTFQVGVGAGITPVDVYMSMQQNWAAAQSLALATSTSPVTRKKIRPPSKALGDPGDITPDYSQIHSTGAAISMFVDWLRHELSFRIGVPDTSFFPHSAIAKLRLFDASGNLIGEGSGFYVGRNKIVTAGHCLVNDDGTRVQGLEVVPGLQGSNEPFGGASVGLAGLKPHPRYNPLAYDPSFDIGVVVGAPDAPLGTFFEMEELTFSPNTGIITCGYAAVGVDPTIQHMDVDTVRELQNGTFTYAAQVRQGSSGGPVFYATGAGSIRAVGLNVTTFDDHQNRGLRLTNALIAWINSL